MFITRESVGGLAAMVLLLPLAAAVAAEGVTQPEPKKLKYDIEFLNAAQAPQLVQPGAQGTAFALRLSVSGGEWARWNLPAIEPLGGRSAVTLVVRQAGPIGSVRVRLLDRAGSEWECKPLKLTDQWQEVKLAARDFRFFRGSEEQPQGPLDFATITQIQIVNGGGKRGGAVDVDQIRFGDAAFTFDNEEQRTILSAEEGLRQRLGMYRASLDAERRRLERHAQWAQACAGQIKTLLADYKRGETYEAFAERHNAELAGRTFAFQTSPASAVTSYPVTSMAADELEQLGKSAIKPPKMITLGAANRWSTAVLYGAKKPAAPVSEKVENRSAIVLAAQFTLADTQQVIFLNSPRIPALDVTGYPELEVDLLLAAGPLHDKMPLLLRLSNAPPGKEQAAFHDFAPAGKGALPRGQWTKLRFSLRQAVRHGGSFDPKNVTMIGLRLQNAPGKSSDVKLSVGEMRLVPPDVTQAGAEALIQAEQTKLQQAQWALVHELESLRIIKQSAWDNPIVQRFVLRAQMRPTAVAEDKPVDAPPPPQPANAKVDFIVEPALDAHGDAQVLVRWPGKSSGDGRTWLLDHAQKVVASAKLEPAPAGLSAKMTLARPRRWSPAYPYLYQVRAAVTQDGKAAAAGDALVGFRSMEMGAGDVSPQLAHAWEAPMWGGGARLNGHPFFIHGVVFHLPKGAKLDEVGPLLGELWVDCLRSYGWSVKPEQWAAGDRIGIGAYASAAPSYKSMADWDQATVALEQHAQRLSRMKPDLRHPSVLSWHAGNEVELSTWGAELGAISPEALWLPLERTCQNLHALPPAPVSYVRAGALRPIPVLPGEDLVGINQYTGRYGGRIEQIAAHLQLFARWCGATARPLAITEWNGPQYSWAANGIGAVTERGAAYYVQRYYEAMADTPGITGSSEFTLNWLLWRVEDLTTHSKAQEWADRPEYEGFGGGHTADHIPTIPLDKMYRGQPFRAMLALQSPFYPLLRTPGKVFLRHGPDSADSAARLTTLLEKAGADVDAKALDESFDPEKTDGHLVLIGGIGSAQPAAVAKLEKTGWIDATLENFPAGDRPLVQRRVNPFSPTRGMLVVTGSTSAGRAAGIEHLVRSAESIVELWANAGAMVRVLAITDPALESAYQRLLLEFVGRGHIQGGDDTRAVLDAAELLESGGKLKPAWWNLNGIIIDVARKLGPAELEGAKKLAGAGVRIVISLPALAANPELRDYLGVKIGERASLVDSIEAAPEFCAPIPVKEVGLVQQDVIKKFAPQADSSCLEIHQLASAGEKARPAAWLRDGRQPVALRIDAGNEHYTVLGIGIGSVATLHRKVATSGHSHPMYDRDTASGLERAGRLALNLCLEGAPQPRILPPLRGAARIEPGILRPGQEARVIAKIADCRGRPQSHAVVRGTLQMAADGQPLSGDAKADVEFTATSEGVYEATIKLPATDASRRDVQELPKLKGVVVQLRAIKPATIPWEGAACGWIQ